MKGTETKMVIVGGEWDGLEGAPMIRVENADSVTACRIDAEGPHAVATLFVSGLGLVQVPLEHLSFAKEKGRRTI